MSHMFSELLWTYFPGPFLTVILMSFKGDKAEAYAESTILNFITLNSCLTVIFLPLRSPGYFTVYNK